MAILFQGTPFGIWSLHPRDVIVQQQQQAYFNFNFTLPTEARPVASTCIPLRCRMRITRTPT